MYIYGEVVIEGRLQRGVFTYTNGEFKRVGGLRPMKLRPLKVGTKEWQDAEDREAVMRLERDLTGLYFLESEYGRDALTQFMTPDGDLDAHRLYYQGNDLVVCYQYQDLAYLALRFKTMMSDSYIKQLDEGQAAHIKTLNQLVDKVIADYKTCREERRTNDEMRWIQVILQIIPAKTRQERKDVKNIQEVINIAES